MKVTNVRISDQRLRALVATATSGELLSAPGHPGQYIIQDAVLQPGRVLQVQGLYSIASSAGASLNWQYSHMHVTSDGHTLHVFYEVRPETRRLRSA